MPLMISKGVSDISSDSDHFNKSAPNYSTSLKKVGSIKIKNTHQAKRNKELERKRQIIWFNPP